MRPSVTHARAFARLSRTAVLARDLDRDLDQQVAELFEADRALCVTAVLEAEAGRVRDVRDAMWEAYEEEERRELEARERAFIEEHGYDWGHAKWLDKQWEREEDARWTARYGMTWEEKCEQEDALWAAHRVC